MPFIKRYILSPSKQKEPKAEKNKCIKTILKETFLLLCTIDNWQEKYCRSGVESNLFRKHKTNLKMLDQNPCIH